MPAGIVVVGGGVAGVHTANLLARRLPAQTASIRLIDATGQHAFQPGRPTLALGETAPARLVRDVRTLLDPRIELVIDEATRLDPTAGRLWMRREGSISYDYAVLATGSRLDREAVPGLAEGAHDFYSVEGASRLREALRRFRGGSVVVGIAGMPYPCPPVPVEFAIRLDGLLRRLGVRERTTLHYLSPLKRALQIEAAADLAEPIFEQRGIRLHTFFNLEEVDPARRRLFSLEGETVDYDMAVLVPPHRGAALIDDSGLGDPGGWIPTDPRTLRVRGYRRLFALGDATDLPISKAGSTAHFESEVVAEQVSAAIRGRSPDPERGSYGGRVVCFLRLGGRKATIIQVDADHAPQVSRPSRWWYLMRWAFERAYWSTMRRGWAFKAERFLPRIRE